MKSSYSSSDLKADMKKRSDVCKAVVSFAEYVSERMVAHYDNDFPANDYCDSAGYPHELRETLEIQEAKKYYKLWWCRDGSWSSIHSFVDKNTGEVFKPASTKAPAKHARGNVLDEDNGKSAIYPKHSPFVRYL